MSFADFKSFCIEKSKCKDGFSLDLNYIIDDGKKHKVAFLCPGGGYAFVSCHNEGNPYAMFLNEHGVSAIIVKYRVDKLASFPNPQDDLAEAIKFAIDHQNELNLDLENYSIWGSSAGGHLAGSFGTKNMGYEHYGLPRPGVVVLVYPVISMCEHYHIGSHDLLIGKKATPEMEKFTSIEQNVDADYPRTYIWCGSRDTCVPPENSIAMDKVLTANNVDHIFRLFPDAGHGIGLAKETSAENWSVEALKFWLNV